MNLEQRHIINFLRIKGLKLGEIAKELSSASGPDAYTSLSVKCWLHQLKLGRTDPRTQSAYDCRVLGDSCFGNLFSFCRENWPYSFLTSLGPPYVNQLVAGESAQTLKSVSPSA
jgi:hypothetical protein